MDDERKRLREARKLAKLREADIDTIMSALTTDERGRNFLWWLLQIGKVHTQPFSIDPLATAFACGELNVGQQVLARLTRVDPEGYLRMMKERANVEHASAPREPDSEPGTEPDSESGSG